MPHRMTLHMSLLGIALLSILACTEPANPPNFPQLSGGPVGLEAMLVGELVSENGCLRLRKTDTEDGAGHLLIWNQTADMTADGQGVRITDESGVSSSFSVGEVLQMGGGETKDPDHVQKNVIQPVPSHCPGPYWLVGLEVTAYSE